MNDSLHPPAITLPFAKQAYTCVWKLPKASQGDSDVEFQEVPGTLNLEGGGHPSASFFGDLPIEYDKDRGAELPQTKDFDSLTASLSNGAHAALLNGQQRFWFNRNGHANGAFVVLSMEPHQPTEPREYDTVLLQVEGLDEISDFYPLEISGPTLPLAPPHYIANKDSGYTLNFDRDIKAEWNRNDTRLRISFEGRLVPDCFDFRMYFSPVLQLSVSSPLTIEEWWRQWIVPLCDLMTAILGRSPNIMFMIAVRESNSGRKLKDQVFRHDINQDILQPSYEKYIKSHTALRIFNDEANLLLMLQEWQRLESEHHPLIEMATVITLSYDQHPRSRYLLLIQALEGLYGFENKENYDNNRKRHTEKRESFIERVQGTLSQEDIRYLRSNLLKSPPNRLETKLIAIFDRLAHDLRSDLRKCELVRYVRKSRGGNIRVETVLAEVRNKLSHGASEFSPDNLEDVVTILDRVVRAEILRIVGAPKVTLLRVLGGQA